MNPNYAIDPQLLGIGTTVSSLSLPWDLELPSEHDGVADNLTRDRQSPIASSDPSSTAPFTGAGLLMKAVPSLGVSEIHSTEINDFDVLFRDFDESEDNEALDVYAATHLALWIAKNKSIELSEKQLKDFEGVTAVPVPKLSKWLDLYGKSLLARAQARRPDRSARRSYVRCATYRVRCTTSEFRYKPRNTGTSVAKVFECTNQCGQTFALKGGWTRHEKVNFEEWICPSCGKALSRRDKLQEHVKDCHSGVRISKLDKQQFLESKQRPCGFCGNTLPQWAAWLTHVASHFENGSAGGPRDMSQWRQYRSLGAIEEEATDAPPVSIESQHQISLPPPQIASAENIVVEASKDLYAVEARVPPGGGYIRDPKGVNFLRNEDYVENTPIPTSTIQRRTPKSTHDESKRWEMYYDNDRERQPMSPRSGAYSSASRHCVPVQSRSSHSSMTSEEHRASTNYRKRKTYKNGPITDTISNTRVSPSDDPMFEDLHDSRARADFLARQMGEDRNIMHARRIPNPPKPDPSPPNPIPSQPRPFPGDSNPHDDMMESLTTQLSGTFISRTMSEVVNASAETRQHRRREVKACQDETHGDRSHEAPSRESAQNGSRRLK